MVSNGTGSSGETRGGGRGREGAPCLTVQVDERGGERLAGALAHAAARRGGHAEAHELLDLARAHVSGKQTASEGMLKLMGEGMLKLS